MEKQTIDLFFPEAGIDRSAAFATQGPQSCIDCLNVVPQDVYLGRIRGGSRMGMVKHVVDRFGSGNQVTLVSEVVKQDGSRVPVLVAGTTFYSQLSGGVWSLVNGSWTMSPSSWSAVSLYTFSLTGRKCWTVLGSEIFVADSEVVQPFFYDASTGSGGAHGNPPLDPLGDVPQSCSVVANIGDRLVFAGDRDAKRAYYMSRVGDPNDFAYGDTDDDRAVSGSLTVGGANSDGIKAIIPWYADYSLWCCETSTILMVGTNPTTGAYFFPISNRLGSLDSMSWCYGPDRSIFIMTRDGLARCDAGNPRAEPQLVAKDKIPRELQAIDPRLYHVTLVWDSRYELIHIFVSKISQTTASEHWAFSIRTGGFFKLKYALNCEPFSACLYHSNPSVATNIMVGCRDGYLRRFDLDQASDDGTNFESYAMLGPFRVSGNEDEDGKILEAVGVMASDSGSVTYDILPGAGPELAYEASSAWSGAFSAGRSDTHRPRVRAGDAIFKISGTPGTAWAMEKVHLVTAAAGRQR